MLSRNGGIPFRATGTGPSLSFCPDCSEVIFVVTLLVPVLHPHRLAETFLRQLLSSSPHFSLFVIISLPIFNCQELSCQQIKQSCRCCLQRKQNQIEQQSKTNMFRQPCPQICTYIDMSQPHVGGLFSKPYQYPFHIRQE